MVQGRAGEVAGRKWRDNVAALLVECANNPESEMQPLLWRAKGQYTGRSRRRWEYRLQLAREGGAVDGGELLQENFHQRTAQQSHAHHQRRRIPARQGAAVLHGRRFLSCNAIAIHTLAFDFDPLDTCIIYIIYIIYISNKI